jgi:hypothetical protein
MKQKKWEWAYPRLGFVTITYMIVVGKASRYDMAINGGQGSKGSSVEGSKFSWMTFLLEMSRRIISL